jgi:hypothetical protein
MTDAEGDALRQALTAVVSAAEYIGVLKGMAIQGLKFQHCQAAFGVDRDLHPLASAAHKQWQKDGDIEIDPITVLSESEDGAYVLGWVWVDRPSTEGTAE